MTLDEASQQWVAFLFLEQPVLTDSPGTKAERLQDEIEQVYRETRVAICSYVLCLGVPEGQAPEITQEAYLRLYETMRKGEEVLNMRAWLFRVAHNLSVRVRSREKAFRSVNADWERFTGLTVETPERIVLNRERMRKVQSALETLSPQQRNCLYLRSEGLRYREIAAVMGISSSTVNEFLRRAISRLAEATDG